MKNKLRYIGFDADDTLWDNEPYFRQTEQLFMDLLEKFDNKATIADVLYKIEMQNMSLYGYGVKAFMLSMIEAALVISKGKADAAIMKEIITLGKSQLNKPVTLLKDVRKVLDYLSNRYRLLLVTKGDILDQERKLEASGLSDYFHHVEILSNKTTKEYTNLLKHIDIEPEEFVMIGNSIKSDIIPPLELGCFAIHTPYHTIWLHEEAEAPIGNNRFYSVEKIKDLLELL